MSAAASAGTWKLGDDLEVTRIGYGAMRLTGNGMRGNSAGTPIDRDAAVDLLHSAFEQGVNHIDTAAFYFSPLRSANEIINRALSSWRGDVVVVTKVGPTRDPSGEWLYTVRPDQLRGQVEENLRQLGRDHLDVVDLRVGGPRTSSIAEHFGALAELRDAGLVRHLGLSAVLPEHMAEAQTIDLVMRQAALARSAGSPRAGAIDLCAISCCLYGCCISSVWGCVGDVGRT
ncbi:aldo/keto reductase family oxidoreductase [Streptomyces noursei ATCC 11455]|nr:aldo/keto reductase family oxidoreductase [Streptomyces noursei ATCC 11455]